VGRITGHVGGIREVVDSGQNNSTKLVRKSDPVDGIPEQVDRVITEPMCSIIEHGSRIRKPVGRIT
jgi:hypothetical protein